MPSDKRTAAPPLAFVVCVLVVAGVAATPGVAVRESLAAAAPQNSSAVEASLALDRSTRRLIQQGLRNEGFDPGMPDGLFGPRTRAAIRDWQQSRGTSPTGLPEPRGGGASSSGRLTAASAARSSPAAPGGSRRRERLYGHRATRFHTGGRVPTAASPRRRPSRPPERRRDEQPAANARPRRQRVRPTAARNPRRPPPPARGTAPRRRRPRRRPRGDERDPRAPARARSPVPRRLRLRVRAGGLRGGTHGDGHRVCEPVPAAGGREGEFYREVLELLASAEVRLERAAPERRRAEAERRRAEADRRRAAR